MNKETNGRLDADSQGIMELRPNWPCHNSNFHWVSALFSLLYGLYISDLIEDNIIILLQLWKMLLMKTQNSVWHELNDELRFSTDWDSIRCCHSDWKCRLVKYWIWKQISAVTVTSVQWKVCFSLSL